MTSDITVYAGFRDARWDIRDLPPQDLLRTQLRTKVNNPGYPGLSQFIW